MSAPLPATLGPVLEFMRSLWALDHALSERAKQVTTRFGITATQRLVVRIVGQSPGASAGSVAAVLHVHPSTLTPVLQQLVSRKLIRRAADPADRRRAVLELTARGEKVDTEGTRAVDERVRSALSRVAPSEVFHARRVLQAITTGLAEADARPRRRKRVVQPKNVARLPRRAARREAPPAAAEPERGAGSAS